MARYRGPKAKIARRFREPIFGPSKALERKKYGPGQHGRGRRGKPSNYAIQLMEKQKAKYTYGLLEKQFRNLFIKASRKSGVTGEIFLQLLESRLDNTIFRLGFAPTRRAARQLVGHKHVKVNGKICNIPSLLLRPGDTIEIREKSKSLEVVNERAGQQAWPWLNVDAKTHSGTFMQYPERDQIPENIKENLIVELYSK
jgi:small subunit ribosomal protein S4